MESDFTDKNFNLTETVTQNNLQNGGGVLSFLFSKHSDKVSKLIDISNNVSLDESERVSDIIQKMLMNKDLSLKIHDIVVPLSENKIEYEDFKLKNKYGMNILHLMAFLLPSSTLYLLLGEDKLLFKLIKDHPDIINNQDFRDNNIGHYIMAQEPSVYQQYVLNILDKLGLKRVINKDDVKLSSEKPIESKIEEQPILSETSVNPIPPSFVASATSAEALTVPAQNGGIFVKKNSNLNDVVTNLLNNIKQNGGMPTETLDFHRSEIMNKKHETENLSSSDFINNLLGQYKNKQTGGKSIVTGKRTAITASDIEDDDDDDEEEVMEGGKYADESESTRSALAEISRAVASKTDEIHERTIKRIMEIMGVNEEDAKIYKSVIYFKVKTEHPELTSYDRAIEMEKLASKDELSSINFQAEKEKIQKYKEQHASEKTSSSDEKPKKKSPKKEKTKKEKTTKTTKTKKTKTERQKSIGDKSSTSSTSDL